VRWWATSQWQDIQGEVAFELFEGPLATPIFSITPLPAVVSA
jgi:hypothetical protein